MKVSSFCSCEMTLPRLTFCCDYINFRQDDSPISRTFLVNLYIDRQRATSA